MLFKKTLRILVVSAGVIFAQYRASLQGTITDATGSVVPGAKITLTSTETNISKTATSSDTGVYAISSLAPGNYTLTWDGKDDEGKLVKAGKYTVCVEAAREHGGHDILHFLGVHSMACR